MSSNINDTNSNNNNNNNNSSSRRMPMINSDFFRDFFEKIKSSPLICKFFAFIVLVFSLFATIDSHHAIYNLSLIPQSIVEFKLWISITAPLLELSIINGIISSISFLIFGAFMKNIWGSKFTVEFIRFLSVIILSSTWITFFCSIVIYLPTQSFLLFAPFYGSGGITGGFLICMKQWVPEQSFSVAGFTLRAKYLPSIYFAITTIIGILTSPSTIPFIWIGLGSAWVYLRFYQKKIDGTIKGDRSEAFSFASFFPEIAHPYIIPVSTSVMNAAVKLRLITPDESLPSSQPRSSHSYSHSQGHKLGHGSSSEDNNQNYLPGSNPKEAERRRNLARRALETRMKQNQAEPDVPLTFDSDDEEKNDNENEDNTSNDSDTQVKDSKTEQRKENNDNESDK